MLVVAARRAGLAACRVRGAGGAAVRPAAASDALRLRWTAALSTTPPSAAAADPPVPRPLLVETSTDGVRTITMSREKRLNAFSIEMYLQMVDELEAAAADADVRVAVLTGTGAYFSSGNDLENSAVMPPGGPTELAAKSGQVLRKFVRAFIHFPKPLIASVNGPAYDIAADAAHFKTPFSALGLSPEGCSSLLFPTIMPPTVAAEVLYGGRTLSADEALRFGFVGAVYPAGELAQRVQAQAAKLASFPPAALQKSKQLVRGHTRQALEAVNEAECVLLEELWASPASIEAARAFFARRATGAKKQ